MSLLRPLLFLLFCALATPALSAIDAFEFSNDVQRQRYYSFLDEMRCPKCQNQNLSGSDSPIAGDLRRELYDLIQDGRSDKEIIDFMVERYGEYILYRPRLSAATAVLWFGPVVLLLAGIVMLILLVRQRRRLALTQGNHGQSKALSSEEEARLQALLASSAQSLTDNPADHKEPRA